MRLNKWIAANSIFSRRKADELISVARVTVNGTTASLGVQVEDGDEVRIDQKLVTPVKKETITLMLNKPAGYVCSRNGQGSQTIYSLLPMHYHHLDAIGRLDKDSSGLLLLTSDGKLHQELTHPSYQKEKVYRAKLNKSLTPDDQASIERGIELEDGTSKLASSELDKNRLTWQIKMHEGRNRQIRRTFGSVGYDVIDLHRQQIGDYKIGTLETGKFKVIWYILKNMSLIYSTSLL